MNGVCFRIKNRLSDYASANESAIGCSCQNCAQCEASWLSPKEAIEISDCIDTLQRELARLHESLSEISSYTISQFAGPHDMAAACVHRASETLCGFHQERQDKGND